MKIIAELVKHAKSEAKDTRKYIELAIKYKPVDEELADMFFDMAKAERSHLDGIHVWLVKFIEKEKKERMQPVPQGMLDVWDWEHQQMVEDLQEVDVMMNSYQKM